MIRLLPLLLLAVSCSAKPAGTQISFKGKTLTVEWIRSDPDRSSTPREHSRLTGDRGFLIGYDSERILHHHTSGGDAAYDIAWFSKDAKLVETATLKNRSEEGVTSTKPAQYALFLAPGWLETAGAKVGDEVSLGGGIWANPAEPLPQVKVNGIPVRVELALANADRQRGLMHRRTMSPDDGMLFIFRAPRDQHFWMGHCHYPLDIAYFDASGKFLNVCAAKTYPDPEGDTGWRANSEGEAKYVLEVHLGWFKAKGLADDDGKALQPITLELPASVRAVEGRAD